MMERIFAWLGLYTTNGFNEGFDTGYQKGLEQGKDLGKRVAYNTTLTKEIPGILSRYSQLQVKLLTKPKNEMQDAFREFTNKELERFKMEMQER